MATGGPLSYVTFLYNDIQWTISTIDIAIAGINGGDGVRSVNLRPPESTNHEDLRNLTTTSNVGVDGMWMYRVDSEGKC